MSGLASPATAAPPSAALRAGAFAGQYAPKRRTSTVRARAGKSAVVFSNSIAASSAASCPCCGRPAATAPPHDARPRLPARRKASAPAGGRAGAAVACRVSPDGASAGGDPNSNGAAPAGEPSSNGAIEPPAASATAAAPSSSSSSPSPSPSPSSLPSGPINPAARTTAYGGFAAPFPAGVAPVATSSFSEIDPSTGDNFCIIDSRESVREFEGFNLEEIRFNIAARRNRIFLLMEEVRRLRIQQRLKGDNDRSELQREMDEETYVSALPFLPPLSEATLSVYYGAYAAFLVAIIGFGGLLAPIAEINLGIGGTSYAQFVESVHLPSQLAQVDPIVASFCGGAVGVLSALMVVELNNVKKQKRNRCLYCQGTGYLTCGNCVGRGTEVTSSGRSEVKCAFCAGTGKVMCTGCLCTGKMLVTEHDPRIDPFM